MAKPIFNELYSKELVYTHKIYQEAKLDEGNYKHSTELGEYLHKNGADKALVVAALIHNLPKEYLDKPGWAKHVLEKETPIGNPKEKKEFYNNLKEAIGIVKGYKQLLDTPKPDINAEFALSLEVPKLRASLLRAADLVFALKRIESKETIEKPSSIKLDAAEFVYVPWASLLGFIRVSHDLGEQVVRLRNPKAYGKLKKAMEIVETLGPTSSHQVVSKIREEFEREGLKIKKIEVRTKSLYSTFAKLNKFHLPLGEPSHLDDLIGARVILETKPGESEQSQKEKIRKALELVKKTHDVRLDKIDDFGIDKPPKASGYTAVHVPVRTSSYTLFFKEPIQVEVHLVTDKMHEKNEYGIPSAHLWYKLRNVKDPLRKRLLVIKKEADERRRLIKSGEPLPIADLFRGVEQPEIRVGTTLLGETQHIISAGSTPIDLWFSHGFHGKVKGGKKEPLFLKGAKINGDNTPLKTHLAEGDNVEFMLSHEPPSEEVIRTLVDDVITPEAREGLKQYLKIWRVK